MSRGRCFIISAVHTFNMNCLEIVAFTMCIGSVCCTFKLQILHTNDMHAHFAEVDEYASSCPIADAKAGNCYGGFARIRTAAIDAKKEASKKNISSIFLNAGDTFQGTPYYTVYKWKVAASIINTLEFDAMVSVMNLKYNIRCSLCMSNYKK